MIKYRQRLTAFTFHDFTKNVLKGPKEWGEGGGAICIKNLDQNNLGKYDLRHSGSNLSYTMDCKINCILLSMVTPLLKFC